MATYLELYDQFSYTPLQNKIAVACIIAAETIRTELDTVDNHANRLIWAKVALEDPRKVIDAMLRAVLAANKDLTLTQIQEATDAAIQAKVDAAVDILAQG